MKAKTLAARRKTNLKAVIEVPLLRESLPIEELGNPDPTRPGSRPGHLESSASARQYSCGQPYVSDSKGTV